MSELDRTLRVADADRERVAERLRLAGGEGRLAPEESGVFEVRPGIIRTETTAGVAARYEALIANGLVPSRRWGEAEDVARAVTALVQPGLAFATGSVVNVDGALAVPRF